MRYRIVAILAASTIAATAAASEIERVPPVSDAATAKECGECHMAFQPALLPAGSWERIMNRLNDHFGEDASLPADIATGIRAYLTANAGRVGDPSTVRITGQRWFVHEHRVSPSIWQRPDIGAASNCPACHPRAENGVYEDDD